MLATEPRPQASLLPSWLTLPNHIWQNTLPANVRKLFFFIKIKCDGITSLHGIHAQMIWDIISQIVTSWLLETNKNIIFFWYFHYQGLRKVLEYQYIVMIFDSRKMPKNMFSYHKSLPFLLFWSTGTNKHRNFMGLMAWVTHGINLIVYNSVVPNFFDYL